MSKTHGLSMTGTGAGYTQGKNLCAPHKTQTREAGMGTPENTQGLPMQFTMNMAKPGPGVWFEVWPKC